MSKDKLNPILENLMERRTVFLEGEIDQESISDVSSRMMRLQTLSSERITLVINSGGGHTYPALLLCDQIKVLMTAPVRGIAFGDCGSAATFIMLHCNERYATPNSRFLIHSGNMGGINIPVDRASSEVAEQLLAELKQIETQVTNLYMTCLTPAAWHGRRVSDDQKRKYVQKLIDRGDQRFNETFSAQEAIEVGLIDSICTTKLDIF